MYTSRLKIKTAARSVTRAAVDAGRPYLLLGAVMAAAAATLLSAAAEPIHGGLCGGDGSGGASVLVRHTPRGPRTPPSMCSPRC